MGLRQDHRARVHERILSVCEDLFRRRGFEATSIDDIASGADISRQTFFNYFPGKDAVAAELAIAWLRRQSDLPRLDGPPEPGVSVLDGARRWVLAQARAIEADRDFMRLIVVRTGRALAGDDEPRTPQAAIGRDIFLGVAEILRTGQAAGEVRADADPLRLAEVYVSAVLMAVRLWLLDDDGQGLEGRVNAVIDILEGGLRARNV